MVLPYKFGDIMIKYCNKCKSKKNISLFYNCSSKRSKAKKIQSKLRSRKHRHDISDRYMCDVLSMNSDLEHEDITDEMIELARINLKIKRNLGLTRKLKNYE